MAAASLAATLEAARRRRVHRQARQVSAAVLLGCAAALGLQSMGHAPATGNRTGTSFARKTGTASPVSADTPAGADRSYKTYTTYISASPVVSRPLVEPSSSFVLVRTRPEPPETAVLPPGSPGVLVVSTDAVPSPLIVTTARTVAPQSIATGDNPQSAPGPASDADLFALADGRPAALCRLASGSTHWFWLDQPSSHH